MPPNRWPGGSIPSGVPYEDLPITNPHCNTDSCHAFAAGWNESYRETSLISQIDYGFWVLCYYLCWTVLFVVAYSIHLIRDHLVRRDSKGNAPTQHPDWKNILVARYRSVAYRRFTGRLSALPSFGILSLFSVSTVFCACLIFPEQPYLRSHFRIGSPPLSIPHMYAPVKDGGVAYLAQLYIDQKRELSGTILYFLFIWLMLLSLPWVRRRAHEFFVCSHVFLGVSFIGILAWHIKGEYISVSALRFAFTLGLTQ
ncbi:ferric reductase transmembrane component 7 [Macrophomina phaseolina MS6]|uniref:Ferric reductase transmembrane component 7 n=1 Tax=Macrophomina phaseolina (strain MS6) TaxID=1126212 RepID=K2RE25_MACPH|nr:ferric reductase transmembrane component 7 [Macrophomina phaseolina MS6]